MPKVKSDDLIRELYNKVRDMILEGELLPGEKLTQEELAAKLGVSRTPLLRALQLLEGDMLVVSIPRRGMYVRKMSTLELRDAFQLRCCVEAMCSGLAAERMTETEIEELYAIFKPFENNKDAINVREYQHADHVFHNRILEGSGNSVINSVPMVGSVLKTTLQYGLLRLPQQTYDEHIRIIDAIAKRDAKAASDAMDYHLSMTIRTIEERMEAENSAK